MPKTPKVSIVVVNYRANKLIAEWKKRFATQPECELLIVDHSHGLAGYGAGCNTGARLAKAPIIIFANPDISLTPKQALLLAEVLETHPEYGLIGPQLQDEVGKVQITCSAAPDPWMALIEFSFLRAIPLFSWWSRAYRLFGFDHTTSRVVPSVSGACFAMRSAEYQKIGGADEEYFLYFEEFDFAQRIQRLLQKKVFYTTEVSVTHLGQVSTRQRHDTLPIFLASRSRYLTKWFGWPGRISDCCLRLWEGKV